VIVGFMVIEATIAKKIKKTTLKMFFFYELGILAYMV